MKKQVGGDVAIDEVDEGVVQLTLNRPTKKNALTRAMYHVLSKSLKAADRNDAVRVVLIRSAGDCFCSGNDIREFQTPRDPDTPSPGMQFLDAINRFEKPLIAAVDGAAVGIGTTMLLHCDLVYASTSANFQLPFVNLGLCPEGASSFLLPRMIGHQRASEMLLLGEPISAWMAWEFGLINNVYQDADLMAEVRGHARRLASQPLESVLLTKRLLKQSRLSTISETIRTEGWYFANRLRSKEFHDAATAFWACRRPGANEGLSAAK